MLSRKLSQAPSSEKYRNTGYRIALTVSWYTDAGHYLAPQDVPVRQLPPQQHPPQPPHQEEVSQRQEPPHRCQTIIT